MKFLILILFYSQFLLAQNSRVIERVTEVSVDADNADLAKKMLIEQATEKISTELIKEIIGEIKFSRNYSIVQNKVIKKSGRYTPSSKIGEIRFISPKNYKMTYAMKINLNELQMMLLEQGLFYDGEMLPIVMPMIKWVDKVNGVSLAWWEDADSGNSLAFRSLRRIESQLKYNLGRVGFYSISPFNIKFASVTPDSLLNSSYSFNSWQTVLSKFGAQIVIDGQIQIIKNDKRRDSYVIEINLNATQVQNGRSVAMLNRRFETDPGGFDISIDRKLKEAVEVSFSDLSSQIFEAWQRGSIGSSLFKLTLDGRLKGNQIELAKELIRNKLPEIKNIKERRISSNSITYEIDSSVSPLKIKEKMPVIEIEEGLKLVADEVSELEVFYKIER